MKARTARVTLALVALWAGGASAASIFDGDPIDPSTGAPMILQPGVARVHPGEDEKYGTGDDVFDTAIVGDFDLVLRTGGVFGGGAFPLPAGSVATAPGAVVGGIAAGGSEIAYDLVASDGAASPIGGNPLLTSELDGRGALLMAFADLDGDGVIGPTDADGTGDDQIERQEILTPAGRSIGLFVGGVATGGIGVTLGAPASVGGLGVVVVGGAATGAVPPLYVDGAWVSTLLPFVPAEDPGRILGGNPAAPDPDYIADVELELDSVRHFVPTGSHPILGTPFAIPLNGSRFSVDLARLDSGADAGVALGVPISAAGFVATPGRRLVPAVGPGASRMLVDASSDLAIADDGPGNERTIVAYAADLFGNPTDPETTPRTFTVEVGPSLRIVSPDLDADPSKETLALGGVEVVSFVVDDAGGADDAAGPDRVVATVGGVPTGVLQVPFGGGGGAAGAWSRSRTVLEVKDLLQGRLRIAANFSFDAGSIDPEHDEVSVTVTDENGAIVHQRTLPPGSFLANPKGTSFRHRDLPGSVTPRIRSFSVRRKSGRPDEHKVRLSVDSLDLTGVDPATREITQTVRFGNAEIRSVLPCEANGKGTALRCFLP